MPMQDRAYRPGQLIWLVTAALAATVALTTPGSAQAVAPPERLEKVATSGQPEPPLLTDRGVAMREVAQRPWGR